MEKIDWDAPRESNGYFYKTLRAGQPRPYADSERVVEIYLKEGLTKQEASDIAKGMNIGFDDSKDKDWYQPKLSYFQETSPGTWEFKMVSAYTG